MKSWFLLAHGVGGRLDLPLSRWQVAWAAAVVLVLSFALLGLLWKRPLLRTRTVGKKISNGFVYRGFFQGVTRLIGLVFFIVVVSAGFFGQDNTIANIGPVTVFIVFWVGIAFVSVLFGHVWERISPWETLGLLTENFRPQYDRKAPTWITSGWVALAPISFFHWFELAYHDGASPRVLGWWALIYTICLLGAAWRWGWPVVRKVEGFSVLFGALAELSPIQSRGKGRIHIRWPLIGVANAEMRPATLAVVLAALGGTAFDGVSRTQFWSDISVGRAGWELTVVNTIGLIWVVVVVGAAYHLASRLGGKITKESGFAERFGICLIPILFGYDLAHYFSLLLLEGQAFLVLLSDPYGKGWNLFGTAEDAINWTFVSPTVVGWVQILGIVGGHLVSVLVAHDRAVETSESSTALRSQYPMLAVMVFYTMFGLVLMTG